MAIYKIGRAEGNHVIVGDKSVSRNHAELEELGAGRFRLKDLGSSSGTHILGGSEWTEIKETEIRHDTRIRFGEYETTPTDLLRDQDKTQVQARPSPAAEAPRPAAPKPPPSAPPRAGPPAPPRPAAPAAARPAPPRPAVAPRPPGTPGAGMDKKTLWFIIGGGGALLLLALIAVVVVLATGGDDRRAEAPPARTETPPVRTEPPPRVEPPTPRREEAPPPRRETPPATTGGPQRMAIACRSTWQGSNELCICILRAVGTVLQQDDYDAAIEVLTLFSANKIDEAKQKVQQIAAQNEGRAQRIVTAVQNLARDCKDVR